MPQPLEPETLPEIPGLDKVIHAVMTGGLLGALVFDTTRRQHWQPLSRRTVAWLALGAALFGIVDEVVQGLLPIGRRPTLWTCWPTGPAFSWHISPLRRQ